MCDYGIEGRKVLVQETGFKPGDRFGEWCAIVLLPDPWVVAVGYGKQSRAAVAALMELPDVQAFIASVKEEASPA